MVQVHKIYGSLAVLPITLTWIYISWMITLVGCRLCMAFEESRKPAPHPLLQGAATREALCARVLLELGRQHLERAAPVRAGWIADELEVDQRLVVEALRALASAGIVAATQAKRWLPARPLGKISLAELRKAARSSLQVPRIEADPISRALVVAWEQADAAASARLGETVEEFLARMDPKPARVAVDSPEPAAAGSLPVRAG